MWLGFLLSVILDGIATISIWMGDDIWSKWQTIVLFIVYIDVIVFCTIIGAFIEKEQLNKEIARYKASKSTIECSLRNENLSGIERIELVKLSCEKNEWLAEKKYIVKKWYNFHLRDNDVLELELINFDKEKNK